MSNALPAQVFLTHTTETGFVVETTQSMVQLRQWSVELMFPEGTTLGGEWVSLLDDSVTRRNVDGAVDLLLERLDAGALVVGETCPWDLWGECLDAADRLWDLDETDDDEDDEED